MFSLIISIISIALVAALAAATVYFGGAAFNKGAAGADASAFINAGQQIAGAFTLSDTDGSNAETILALSAADINGNIYLSQVPTYKGTALVLDATAGGVATDGYVGVPVSMSVCLEIQKKVNPAVTDVTLPTTLATGLFGCHASAVANGVVEGVTGTATTPVAFYKVK